VITMEDWVTIRNIKRRNPKMGTREIAKIVGCSRNTSHELGLHLLRLREKNNSTPRCLITKSKLEFFMMLLPKTIE
jgi:hypothetical protein